jgi:transglutaminase-like putative cysteine protease
MAISSVMAVLLGVAWFLVLESGREAEPSNLANSYPLQRTIKYSFVLRNPSQRTVEHATFWAYAPVQQTAHQYVTAIAASHPFHLEKDRVGNQRLQFDVGTLPPFSSRLVDVQVDLRLSKQPIRTALSTERLLSAQTYIELNAPELQRIAKSLDKHEPDKTARATYDWVRDKIKNKGYVAKDRGALYAIRHGEGDCSEQMYLYTALARLNGLPTVGVAGYPMKESSILHAVQLHNWAEVSLDGDWMLVDPDRNVLASNSTDYLAIHLLAGDSKFQGDGSQQMFGSDDGLLIAMN